MIKKLLILLLLCLCVPAVGQVPYQKPMMGQQIDWSHPLAKGLVGYWPMLEGTGNITQDLSGNGYHGSFIDTNLTWSAGTFGSCLSNNGSSDGMSFTTPLQLVYSDNHTISFWLKTPSLDNPYQIYLDMKDKNNVRICTIGQINTVVNVTRYLADNTYSRSCTLTLNVWQHIVLVYNSAVDAKRYTIYVNNIDVSADGTANWGANGTASKGDFCRD